MKRFDRHVVEFPTPTCRISFNSHSSFGAPPGLDAADLVTTEVVTFVKDSLDRTPRKPVAMLVPPVNEELELGLIPIGNLGGRKPFEFDIELTRHTPQPIGTMERVTQRALHFTDSLGTPVDDPLVQLLPVHKFPSGGLT